MKAYKNYIVQNASGWAFGIFSDISKACDFMQALVLPDAPVFELFGTDDDPETYLSGEIITTYDSQTGAFFPPVKPAVYDLAKRINEIERRFACSDDDISTISDIINSLQDKDGLYSLVEHLTTIISTID